MASRSLNKVVLIGNLTRDPELKYTPAGVAVCTFGVATNRSWTTADGSRKDEAQYHRIVAWQKLAELCGKLLVKGRKVYLEGRLMYRTFTGRDGVQRTIAEIVLDDFIVFGDMRKPSETAEEIKTEEPAEKSKAGVASATGGISEGEIPVEENTDTAKNSRKPEVNEDINPDDIPF